MLFDADEVTTYTAGELLYVTAGEHSSFAVQFIARVLKPFDARAYIIHDDWPERVDEERLLNEGFLEELPARPLHVSRD